MKLPNIFVRALSGIVFVGLLLSGILINEYTFAVVFAVLTGLLLFEFYGLIEKVAKVPVSKYLNIIGGLLLFGAAYYTSRKELDFPLLLPYLPYIIYILVVFISELYLKRPDPLKSLAYSILGQIYIALPFAFSNYIAFAFWGYTPVFILAVLVIIWVNDTFAYLTGMLLGKHRMFERISPKKSWEGFAGGLMFAIITGILFSVFSNYHLYSFWIGFAIIVVAFCTLGDLVESLFKRTLGVKDSGNMIPGHGGILDRFDSTILAIPAVVVYIALFWKISSLF